MRSVPRARAVPSGSIIRAAQTLSRPNRVKNHGAPAARKTSSGVSGVDIRRPWRSSRQRLSSRLRRRSSARTSGFSQVGAAGGLVTAAPTSSMRTSHSRLDPVALVELDGPDERAGSGVQGGARSADGDAGVPVRPDERAVDLRGHGLLPERTELDPVDVEQVGAELEAQSGADGRAGPGA